MPRMNGLALFFGLACAIAPAIGQENQRAVPGTFVGLSHLGCDFGEGEDTCLFLDAARDVVWLCTPKMVRGRDREEGTYPENAPTFVFACSVPLPPYFIDNNPAGGS